MMRWFIKVASAVRGDVLALLALAVEHFAVSREHHVEATWEGFHGDRQKERGDQFAKRSPRASSSIQEGERDGFRRGQLGDGI